MACAASSHLGGRAPVPGVGARVDTTHRGTITMSSVHDPRLSIQGIREYEEAHHPRHEINVGEAERWASAIGGTLLVAHGLRRGSFGGLALAILGGSLVYRGVTG